MKLIDKRTLLAGVAAMATLAGAGQSFAQATDTATVEELIVTGSRIKRADITGVGPATVISQEQIERTGLTNVEALLQRLPASAGNAANDSDRWGSPWSSTTCRP